MKRARTSHHRGFTLLELILASGIVALLMLSLYTALHAAFQARMVMNTQTAKVRAARVALDLIEQDLKSIMPPSTTAVLAGPFISSANEIDCYTLGRDYGQDNNPQADGMRYVSVMMDSSAGAPALVRKVTRSLITSGASQPTTEVIASDVTAFAVSYYDGSTWADTYDSTAANDALPIAVRVTVTVQALPTDQPYSMSRLIPLSCGVNVNNQTSTSASSTGSGTTVGSP